MTARRPTTVAIAALLAASVAGCSTGGEAPNSFPPRPVDVAVDGVRPCATLDASQRRALGLRDGTPGTVTVNGLPSAICTWISNDELGYNVQTISMSAELALTEPDARLVTVNGFGGAQSVLREMTGGGPTCQITIDAAPERAIRVQVGAIPRPPLPSDDEMCRLATGAASTVMTTVVKAAG